LRIREGEIKKEGWKIEVRKDRPNGEGVKQISSEVFVSFVSNQKNGEKCIYKTLTIKESKK